MAAMTLLRVDSNYRAKCNTTGAPIPDKVVLRDVTLGGVHVLCQYMTSVIKCEVHIE